jgi:energy-coupling factor transporter ATP-binding protein EcfA2
MYLKALEIQNLRVFGQANATFQYPNRVLAADARKLEYPNVNLILGNNGTGKSTLLKAIALACLGPLAGKFAPYMLVRRCHPAKPRRKRAAATDIFPEDRRRSGELSMHMAGSRRTAAVRQVQRFAVVFQHQPE